MSKDIQGKQFQYEIQAYQEDCVNNIISLFDRLRQKINFCEVLKEHYKKNKYNFPVPYLPAKSFSESMSGKNA